jgi:hypothetical protein
MTSIQKPETHNSEYTERGLRDQLILSFLADTF